MLLLKPAPVLWLPVLLRLPVLLPVLLRRWLPVLRLRLMLLRRWLPVLRPVLLRRWMPVLRPLLFLWRRLTLPLPLVLLWWPLWLPDVLFIAAISRHLVRIHAARHGARSHMVHAELSGATCPHLLV